jgi:hypothetical protein
VPDGSVVVTGGSALPPDLTAAAPHYTINLTNHTAHAYIAKFPANSNQPAWTTDLIGGESMDWGVIADGKGNLYWPGVPYVVSGGGLNFESGFGFSELSADGSRLQYATSIPAWSNSVVIAAAGDGLVYFGGSTNSGTLPVTPGVIQPARDPIPPGTQQNPLNWNHGFVGELDLSSFSDGNFFVLPPPFSMSLTWRIGGPVP